MHGNKSACTVILFALVAFLVSGMATSAAQDGDRSALAWLRENKIPVAIKEAAVAATIFTIVPSSKRMVVKKRNPEQTLVLGIMDNVEVGDGKTKLAIDNLQRGNDVVVILERDNYARAIYVTK